MDTLQSMQVFCLVAELKSFTAAADRLGMSTAMVSKHVAHLEKRLKTRLLHRTSRRVGLSEMGNVYFEQARKALDSLDEVEAAVSRADVTPRGVLKLSGPVWLANTSFVRLLAGYSELYPEVRLEVDLSGRMVNLVEERFDLALRMTHSLDAGLIARPVAEVVLHLVASPAYLERRGRPAALEELNGHQLLNYSLSPLGDDIRFGGDQGDTAIKFVTVLRSTNETLLHMAALEGMGMTFLPRWMIADDVAAGRLELLLPQQARFGGRLYGVYVSRKFLSANVRTFIDFLAENPLLGTAQFGSSVAQAEKRPG